MVVAVGELACQKDSFLKEIDTTVVSCEQEKNSWVVVLEDTVLFPTGGGQPCDHGTIVYGDGENGIHSLPVREVRRNKVIAEHIVPSPIPVGQSVRVTVDWQRRYDHMQQHSGQHLVSALCDRSSLETLSWYLAPEEDTFCFIEIPRKLTDAEIESLQSRVNKAIQRHLPIGVKTITNQADADTSKIPKDYDFTVMGCLRQITIEGIDSGLCCGTHLKNTAELGCCVIVNQSPGKGTNFRVYYVLGDRAQHLLSTYDGIMRALNKTLSCGTSQLVEKVDRQNATVRQLNRTVKELQKELGKRDAPVILAELEKNKRVWLVKDEPEPDYMASLLENLKVPEDCTLVTISGTKGNSAVQIIGKDSETVAAQGMSLMSNLKGGGRGLKWQGKIADVNKKDLKSFEKWFKPH